ncbi:Fatty acid oxidation complex subunit alpha [BD1-7 clade bacterium]|uniref:Fatty acid oxidation complex subunit alpha n=1 Tax=BD1-7 clade bacterium TaxID=2029982 RepID=A0A5S9R115_9GAMM|nr:Fatty acid oxidation complex subunit alpha [BD1-7 clade bacterium]
MMTNRSIHIEKDADNIIHLILDNPRGSANLLNTDFISDLIDVCQEVEQTDHIGVIIRSAKATFMAGGDLDMLYQVDTNSAGMFYDSVESFKHAMRRLETGGKPVVACINGAALGGGLELALSCHHRISLDDNVTLGLPEVTLGLLPGGGGIVRMVRLLGLQQAMPYLTEGKKFDPAKGQTLGIIHDIVADEETLFKNAVRWIKDNPESHQPWDEKGYRIPGGKPDHPTMAQLLPIAPAMMRNQTKGTLPAPEYILCAMVEGAQVDFDTALRIESRYFVNLTTHQVAKNMIHTFWYQLNEIKAGASRPDLPASSPRQKIGILGAGMMGSGITYACADIGIDVVLKDVTLESAKNGKAYSEKRLQKRIGNGRLTAEQAKTVLSAIHPTDNAGDLAECDLIIEAVFEDRQLKAQVTQEAEPHLSDHGIFSSNTSTLPISGLSQASLNPEKFIGLHFFSPADKMPLVEIICGQNTSDETLAIAYDFVLQIGKTPIVVNDSRGFFTSRVFGMFCLEGAAMLGEGIPAATIENAAFLAGFPVGPLAVVDEVSLTLLNKIKQQEISDLEAEGNTYNPHPGDLVIDAMLSKSRAGKAAGAGFYNYPASDKKHLWPGLPSIAKAETTPTPLNDVKDRLLFIMALETARCYDEGVLTSTRDANIGSIFGIGYPPWTGGALQFIRQYGVDAFNQRANDLAERYGDRFSLPDSLVSGSATHIFSKEP